MTTLPVDDDGPPLPLPEQAREALRRLQVAVDLVEEFSTPGQALMVMHLNASLHKIRALHAKSRAR